MLRDVSHLTIYNDLSMTHPDIYKDIVKWGEYNALEIWIKLSDKREMRYNYRTKDIIETAIPEKANRYEKGVARGYTPEGVWMKQFRNNLIRMLEEKQMTAEDLSERSQIQYRLLVQFINGTKTPSTQNIVRITKALGCTVGDLINFSCI